MSLKARIEAVIYAAEEPVTLAQLASLFRDEALAHRATRLAPEVDSTAPPEAEIEASANDLLPPSEAPSSDEREAPPAGREGPEPEGPDDSKKAARALDRSVRDEIRLLLDELIADYNGPDRGLEIREVAGGFRIATRPEFHDAVRAFIKTLKPPLKLSLQALETLAVIAYKQPVTAPEIGDIRGVDSSGVLGSLIARKLITTAGRKQVIGRPILYKTTKEFLLRFGLRDLNELPSIEEFEKMAADLEEEASPPDAEGDSPSAQDLPFAQNEIAELEENSPENGEGSSPQDSEPAAGQDASLEEGQR